MLTDDNPTTKARQRAKDRLHDVNCYRRSLPRDMGGKRPLEGDGPAVPDEWRRECSLKAYADLRAQGLASTDAARLLGLCADDLALIA